MNNLAVIVEQLVRHGRDPGTPVALIKKGCGPGQETVVGTLADIIDKAAERELSPPVVIVVGEVVKLREKLRWYDNQPLFGKRILVTRARRQASALSRLLAERGARPVEMPVIGIQALSDTAELDEAILHMSRYQWVVFTSVNGVEAFLSRLRALNLDARWLKGITIGAMGPATAGALQKSGLYPDYMPENYTSDAFIAGLGSRDVAGCRFLLPRADIAPKDLVDGIARLGAEAHEITAYHTVPVGEDQSPGKQMLSAGNIDIVTFTSSSTVSNLVKTVGDEWQSINRARVACIGPQTAAAAKRAGLRVDIVASSHTIPGLVEAMEEYFQKDGREAV